MNCEWLYLELQRWQVVDTAGVLQQRPVASYAEVSAGRDDSEPLQTGAGLQRTVELLRQELHDEGLPWLLWGQQAACVGLYSPLWDCWLI